MAGKRGATSDLNHDNWNQDEEPEDAGTFQRATEDSLKRRIIKTARRRNPISSVRDSETDTKSAFTGFTGFSKTAPPASTPTFSFLSNLSNQTGTGTPKTNGTNKHETDTAVSDKTGRDPVATNDTKGKSNDYYSKLKGLNESVSSWIKQHVDTNPLIDLQPIFEDYKRYFQELESDKNKTKVLEKAAPLSGFVFKAAENVPDKTPAKDPVNLTYNSFSNDNIPKFGFSSTATSNTFSFRTSTSSKSTVTPSFSFGGNVTTPDATGVSFTASTPFTFNNVSQVPTDSNKAKASDEEDEEPPKVEFTPVVEKDHVYTTRCKVFVKKDGSFGDRGVGNLYLKPIENSEKVQVIVRADTNLGNLLCNFILSEGIPTKRMGKKDVMLVCLPTPDFNPPPVPVLLRVKSPEEADKLLQVLEKHKK